MSNIISIDKSVQFFHPHIELRAMAAAAAPESANAPTDGLISYVLASEKVSPIAQKSLDEQKNYILSLAGVGNAYARKMANDKKDPNLVYDINLWQEIYNNLPLMSVSQFTNESYNATSVGIEVSTKLIETILGFAVAGGAALAPFASYISGLGDSIKAGVELKNKTFTNATIAAVLRTQDAQPDNVEAYLRAYFIDFSVDDKKVYTSCASAQSVTINFNYKYGNSLFNIGALNDKTVKEDFQAFLSGTQIADIKSAQNFFGGSFGKKTS
ncbi:MAG: hypothetical protein PHF31_07210 [Methylobacter sp.]|nr:hypothetical protein [Methylobacter sp.]